VARRLIFFLAMAVLGLLFSGCFGGRETDDVAYILVIGHDKAEEPGKIKFTYQIAVPRGAGGSGGGGGGESTGGGKAGGAKASGITNTITAPTPAEARMLLNSTLSRFPSASHAVALIFSEEVAREGLHSFVSYAVRNRDFHGSLLIVVVAGSAEEYIRKNIPRLEPNMAKFYEVFIQSAAASGFFLRSTLHGFYTRLKNPGASPYALYSGLNPGTGQDIPAGPQTPEQKGEPYLPRGAPITGTGNPAEFIGMAVFRGDKMVGVLDSEETRAVNILMGKLPESLIGVVDPLEPSHFVGLSIRNAKKPQITASLNGGAPIFDVDVPIEAEIITATSGINYEAAAYRKLLEAQVSHLLAGQIQRMLRHTQALGADVAGFGMHLRPQFPDASAMLETNFSALYQAADIRLNVSTEIRRTGLEWQTSANAE